MGRASDIALVLHPSRAPGRVLDANSLLDLPFLPDELRELAPSGSLPGARWEPVR